MDSLGAVTCPAARILTDLADHVGTEQQHRDALIRWDPVKYKRVHALTYADLGDSLAAQARADEAVAAWSEALTLMDGMTSDRTRKAITSIRSTLAVCQRRKVPGAAELARRAREALSQHAHRPGRRRDTRGSADNRVHGRSASIRRPVSRSRAPVSHPVKGQ